MPCVWVRCDAMVTIVRPIARKAASMPTCFAVWSSVCWASWGTPWLMAIAPERRSAEDRMKSPGRPRTADAFAQSLHVFPTPRAKAAAAACFCGGFLIAALGVKLHQIALVYLGYGFIGGIGLGLGYISPVSTLIKWFPDRPGMATGMAIMGFGGGAMIGSPLSVSLMKVFTSSTSTGVAEAMAGMGVLYFALMMFVVFTVRVPPPNWKPEG